MATPEFERMFGTSGYPALFSDEFKGTWKAAGFDTTSTEPMSRVYDVCAFMHVLSTHKQYAFVKKPLFKISGVPLDNYKSIYFDELSATFLSKLKDLSSLVRTTGVFKFKKRKTQVAVDVNRKGSAVVIDTAYALASPVEDLESVKGMLYQGRLPTTLMETFKKNGRKSVSTLGRLRDVLIDKSTLRWYCVSLGRGISLYAIRTSDRFLVLRAVVEFPHYPVPWVLKCKYVSYYNSILKIVMKEIHLGYE